MSYDLLNNEHTVAHANQNGVVTYSNKNINVVITSTGEVYRDGVKLQLRKNGQVTVKVGCGSAASTLYASFNTLYSRMVLGIKMGSGNKLKLKDVTKGYVSDNVLITKRDNDMGYTTTLHKQTTANDTAHEFYTEIKGSQRFLAEDGAVFPTKELAEWHQEKVEKGKANAQVVLDYNGGYILAEQIYLQEVVYNKSKPYVNFVDVMSNSKGVEEESTETRYVFDKLTEEHGFHYCGRCVQLLKGSFETHSKGKAASLQTALKNYSNACEVWSRSVKTLADELLNLDKHI